MAGKLIVIDGVDASGKETQSEILYKRLLAEGKNAHIIHFPSYDEGWCIPVKMYLAGEFGTQAQDVNPYAASTLYAVDRFASYKKKWQDILQNGGVIIADRYTTSNAIHQGSKLTGKERIDFFSWLYTFEFSKMGLPKPDLVLFLDMPPQKSIKLMESRTNKATGKEQKDIHERDKKYLYSCYNSALEASEFYGWERIKCTENNELKTPLQISDEIFARVKSVL